MVDWGMIANLATACGTLVLAVATFSSVRSSNRTARSAERSLQAGLRPVLFASRPEDPPQTIRWGDNHWATVPGGGGVLDKVDHNVYLAISLRNVGAGLAVIHGWQLEPTPLGPTTPAEMQQARQAIARPDPAGFRPQGRDLYVPAGDVSFWQAAIRNEPDFPRWEEIVASLKAHRGMGVNLLYSDHEGGQRTISRFQLTQRPDEDNWICSVVRHWNLDRDDPR